MNPHLFNLNQLKSEISTVALSDLHQLRKLGKEALKMVEGCVEQMKTYHIRTGGKTFTSELIEDLEEIEEISEETARQIKTDLLFAIEVCIHALAQPKDDAE